MVSHLMADWLCICFSSLPRELFCAFIVFFSLVCVFIAVGMVFVLQPKDRSMHVDYCWWTTYLAAPRVLQGFDNTRKRRWNSWTWAFLYAKVAALRNASFVDSTQRNSSKRVSERVAGHRRSMVWLYHSFMPFQRANGRPVGRGGRLHV